MFLEIFKFEWAYRRGRPATYIYFALLLFIGFLMRTTDVIQISTGGQLKQNASLNTAMMMISLLFTMGTFIISAVMGVAVVRDAENNTESLFFTTPVRKFDYLFGRFAGSFLVLLLILTSLPLGMWLGDLMPWRDAERMLPVRAVIYWQPFLTIVVPQAFILSVFFFSVGALSRRMVVIFTQGLFFLLLYFAGQTLLGQLDNRDWAARLDIFGLRAVGELTRYWPIAEQNNRLVPMEGILLENRLIWLGVALVLLVITYRLFAFRTVAGGGLGKLGFLTRKQATNTEAAPVPANIALPEPHQYFGWGARLMAFWRMVPFYARVVYRDLPFVALAICGYALLIFAFYQNTQGDTPSQPLSTEMANTVTSNIFSIIVILIGIMYAGELVWRERAVRLAQIQDAMPLPTGLTYLSQFMAILLVLIGLYVGGMGIGMLAQLVQGYTNIELLVYAKELATSMLGIALYIGLAFAVQLLVNNKFAGHAIVILIMFGWGQLTKIGLEHPLTQFDSGWTGSYSDLNGYMNPIGGYLAFKTYWLAFVALFLVGGLLLSVRGTEESFRVRWQQARRRFTTPFAVALSAAAVLLVSSGAYVYYNTSVLNKFRTEDEGVAWAVDYEKTLKKFDREPQPKITGVTLEVDLFPSKRGFSATGTYVMQNRTKQPIKTIYVQMDLSDNLSLNKLQFDRAGRLDTTYAERFRFRAYTLAQPLQPGDSLRMTFAEAYTSRGFSANGASAGLVPNGTFIDQSYFPVLGYESQIELGDDDKRKENKLPEKERLPARNDPRGLSQGAVTDDADEVNFAITVSTEADQTAVAPGYLQRTWEKPGPDGEPRRYFSYRMDRPIELFYAIVSARYTVKKEVYTPKVGDPVNLEIYYHASHDFNLDRMMRGMKASLDYYGAAFGPYQHRQLRLLEFPRYRGFAQSFANTVPFAEGMGFTQKISDKPGKIDYAFYVTCHETAHQWWGHQVESANVQGGALLIEALSQYSALMVMKQTYPKEMMQKFLKNELDDYLSGRGSERKKEKPLATVENQQYIHYNKGSLAMYALQDYIGEANVNRALRSFRDKWNLEQLGQTGRYPTSADLIAEFRAVTPDSLQSVVTDLFDTITLFENKIDKVTSKPVGNRYDVTLTLSVAKFRADSLGNETPTKLNDLIYIGVYGKGKDDQDKLLFYQKYRLTKPKETIMVRVHEKPTRGGIDPLNLLVDRNSGDNVKAVE
ncbi:MAG: aminopeptidase [Cytophagales bacterium]|nr:MAG: aminopeptidase [Cytophagales bacterium]